MWETVGTGLRVVAAISNRTLPQSSRLEMVIAWTSLVGSGSHSEEWSDDIEKVELVGISDRLDVAYESQESRMILVRSTIENQNQN